MFKASPFKLNIYKQCPKRYKFHYIDELYKTYKKPRPYLTMGDHIHATLKDFMSVVPEDSRTFENIKTILREKWRRNRSGFKDIQDEKRWGEKALLQLRNFVDSQNLSITPFLVEDIYDYVVDDNLSIMGKIDRADRLSKGGLHVIDYKTGKLKNEDVDRTQLDVYSIILQHRFKTEVNKASYYFLAANEYISFKVTKKYCDIALSEIQKQVSIIQDDQQFEALPNPFCSTCDFLEICPKKDQAMKVSREVSEDEILF